jgi:tRNA dimethylallyltransferase
MVKKPAILVILGPTASGKSDLAVTLAKKLNGEIVSADSRQVYKGLDIGTGKITKKEMKGVPHYLLDVVVPDKVFSVNEYQKLAYEAIDNIVKRGKLPIVVGGTGFYIQSIVDGLVFPKAKADKALREKLNKLTPESLFKILVRIDPKRAAGIDANNKVRLVRAIELIKAFGVTPKIKKQPRYECLQIGIKFHDELLKERIRVRLDKRLQQGMIQEAEELHKKGLSWRRMEQLGLEYRYLAYYLQKKISIEEMIKQINMVSWHYAKRQMTWFKRDNNVWWIEVK